MRIAGVGGRPARAPPACAGQRSEAPAQTQAAGRLEFYDWWLPTSSPLQEAWWKFVKEDFERKHSGVTVEFNFISGTSGVREKLMTAAAADTSPDGSHASVAFVRSMWDAGLLEDLGPYVARTPDVAMSKFLDQALFYNQKNGKIYGLPMEGPDADSFFFNVTHFKEVGLDPSPDKTSRWTYDDLVAAATKLTKGSGDAVQRRGVLPHGISTGNVTAWLYTNGATWYGKDNLSVAFNTPQGVQTLEYLLDLRKRFPDPASYAGIERRPAVLPAEDEHRAPGQLQRARRARIRPRGRVRHDAAAERPRRQGPGHQGVDEPGGDAPERQAARTWAGCSWPTTRGKRPSPNG